MSDCNKLLKRARNSPSGLRFEEICRLAECHGFIFVRQSGTSHRIYKHSKLRDVVNFQSDAGRAKSYQVKQLLNAIGELAEIESREEGDEQL